MAKKTAKKKKRRSRAIAVDVKKGPNGKWVVVPGQVKPERHTTVTWTAHKSNVILLFPKTKLFGVPYVEIDADSSHPLTVRAPRGKFPYAAFVVSANTFAEGGSHPEVIVQE